MKFKVGFSNFIKNKTKAPCSSSPCQNGGACNAYNNATSPYYSCACTNGYTGITCQTSREEKKRN